MSSSATKLPQRKEKKHAKHTKKKKTIRLIIKTFLAFFIIILSGAVYYAYEIYNHIAHVGVQKSVPVEMSAKTRPITMMILGLDGRPENKADLSDVTMVLSLNPSRKSATLVALPRDTYMNVEGYEPNRQLSLACQKLNAYYPRFKVKQKKTGENAEDEMKKFLGKYLNTPIDYYVIVKFDGFREIVDKLGGVDVDVTMNMCYIDPVDGTNINLKKGHQHLNGKEALDYVRYRKSNCRRPTKETQEWERNKRQHEVLQHMLDKLKTFNGLLNSKHILQVINNHVQTDIENEQVKHLISTYWNISKENVKFVPVTGEWKSPFVYINEDELSKAKEALRNEVSERTSSAN